MKTTIGEQRAVIFEPISLPGDYQFILPRNTKEINITLAEGIILNGLLYEHERNTELMIYFQGNAKNLQNFLDAHSMTMEWGYNILVIDYRSFGKSSGEISGQEQLYADAEIVYAYALELGYAPENLILYGYSMGTAMAAYLASKYPAKAVILESGYSSIAEINWVGDQCPAFELDTAQKAAHINIPVLLIHGDQDDVITTDHADRIWEKLPGVSKQKIILTGGGHGDLRTRPEYKSLINNFIDNIA